MRGVKKCIGIAMLVLGIGVGGAAGKAQATPANTMTTPGNEYVGSPYTLGFEFQVLSSTIATQLGVYDSGQDGLANPATVGIWETAGTLLVFGTVPTATGGTLDGFFRYGSTAPFPLTSGVNYIIGSHLDDPASSLFIGSNGGSGSVDPNVVLVRDRFGSPGFVFPGTTNNIQGAWLGANFEFGTQAGPEPGTWLLLAAGLVGLFGYGWRQRKKAA